MNTRIVGRYLGRILTLEGVFMIPSLILALFSKDNSAAAFAVTLAVQMPIGIALASIKPKNGNMNAREGFVIVAVSWIAISLFGAMPFRISGAIPSYLNAVFETVSGFTTTGATILKDVEIVPRSLLLWRSLTHWLGGMGVLVLLLALASGKNGDGASLFILRAESPGPNVGKITPKITYSARIPYLIYLSLTVLEIIVLVIGKMPFFDALTTSFGTASTGGFGIKNDSLASYSPFCQSTVAVFMLLFGVNFTVYFFILIGALTGVWKNTELRVYLAVIFLSSLAVALSLTFNSVYPEFGESLHHSFFQVVSIITTSGFSTADFNLWPEFTHTVILGLMIIGACAGSTGGGIKVARIVILFKSAKMQIKKLIHPRNVYVVMLDGKPLEKDSDKKCYAYLFAYLLIIAVSFLILSLEANASFSTNFSATISCFNNIGPGFDAVGPLSNYDFYSPLSKIVLIADMLLGRLEIFPLVFAVLPSTWSRRG